MSAIHKYENALYLARLLIVPVEQCDQYRQSKAGCSQCRVGRLRDLEGRDLICKQEKVYPEQEQSKP